MSLRYKGAVISATPPTTTGGPSGTAPGSWTLQQQLQAQSAGTWPSQPLPAYIEDTFSTYLYTGNGSTQTITNGIDITGKGGLVWMKARSTATSHVFADTTRPVETSYYNTAPFISSDLTDPAYTTLNNGLSAFNSNGFAVKRDGASNSPACDVNVSGQTYASWTFRKQPKFFDVVKYTGTGSNTTIAHNLGSTPGCIIVKRTDTTSDWQVYHRSLTSASYGIQLNLTNAQASNTTLWNSTDPTSTVFSVGTNADVNASGGTYVAYLFAHNAGGFGLTGTDNVISCGSYTGDDSDNGSKQVNLGFEPQWVLIKSRTGAQNWFLVDNMRGMTANGSCNHLRPNLSGEEQELALIAPTATGFNLRNAAINTSGSTYIYIAIRRGPMKTPTTGTSVFTAVTDTPASNNTAVSTTNLVDMIWSQATASSGGDNESYDFDRLRGSSTSSQPFLKLCYADTEVTQAGYGMGIAQNTGYIDNWFYWQYGGGRTIANWTFSRAPGFFDVVCYTGTGSNTTQTHNLGAVPELIIAKRRNTSGAWSIYSAALANTEYLVLNTTAAKATNTTYWNSTTPTSTVFSIGTNADVNANTGTYVAYLFATVAGVSKVGSYTGTGGTQTIDCGFTGGARFVMIKRTDSTGDWYVWDTTRGMVAGTDPYLLLNVQSAQVNANNVYTTSVGFQIVGTGAGFNANGGTYIFLAIA